MITRRKFIRNAGAAVAAVTLPASFDALALQSARTQQRRPIPGTGETLPLIGYGNSPAFRANDVELSRRLLEILLEYGGGYVDLGGSSRQTINTLVSQMQAVDAIFAGNMIDTFDADDGLKQIKLQQAAQGGGPLDLVASRHVDFYLQNASMFRGWKEQGLTRYIGVARSGQGNHQSMMQLIARGDVDFVQTNYSMFEPEAAERLLPMAQDKGVAVLVNRPFLNGRYFSIIKDRPLPEWAKDFDCHSWAQFSLKYIVSHPAVTSVLTETGKPEHARDNLHAGLGRMPDQSTRQRMLALMQGFA